MSCLTSDSLHRKEVKMVSLAKQEALRFYSIAGTLLESFKC
ncbi:hypothetical protein PRUB_a4386 [Pseudoalteromonas rubra]|uniref:Uncharacterized protein n=1 Tax=Pseudoalteromonas rubra TaxID=43658 RepID=A0A8T0C9C7_9GAMM|nr:hypothetical protein PRUB_a4386 [Pseudoalteromonas rubra]